MQLEQTGFNTCRWEAIGVGKAVTPLYHACPLLDTYFQTIWGCDGSRGGSWPDYHDAASRVTLPSNNAPDASIRQTLTSPHSWIFRCKPLIYNVRTMSRLEKFS